MERSVEIRMQLQLRDILSTQADFDWSSCRSGNNRSCEIKGLGPGRAIVPLSLHPQVPNFSTHIYVMW